jgi:zinc and cadmium transporter
VLLNLASAVGGVLGAAAMLLFGSSVPHAIPYVLAFAAGSFLYIAMVDLIPTLHRGNLDSSSVRQVLLMAAGLLSIALL